MSRRTAPDAINPGLRAALDALIEAAVAAPGRWQRANMSVHPLDGSRTVAVKYSSRQQRLVVSFVRAGIPDSLTAQGKWEAEVRRFALALGLGEWARGQDTFDAELHVAATFIAPAGLVQQAALALGGSRS